MRKKTLFDYAERYTELGDTYHAKIAAALKPIFAEAEANNVKLRELSHATALTASMLEVEVILARDVSKLKERWHLADSGSSTGVLPKRG